MLDLTKITSEHLTQIALLSTYASEDQFITGLRFGIVESGSPLTLDHIESFFILDTKDIIMGKVYLMELDENQDVTLRNVCPNAEVKPFIVRTRCQKKIQDLLNLITN